ncbi:AAA family ATPase [Pelagibacterium sediminicola]|uniref:AAA family ATPase n=1 Tax=Pelagibacterium sediminicola TaxID=2248761 RepID=UPI000E3157B5|nr:AAA family ATPase [Pelagibacterium sediminicola]
MSKFFDLYSGDLDDDPQAENEAQKSAARILAEVALQQALDAPARKTLKTHPGLFIFAVPTEPWISPIAKELKSMDRAPLIVEASEQRKSGGKYERVGLDALDIIQQGRSVLFVSQNPDDFLREEVLASADIFVRIPALTAELLRAVIGQLTRGVARGVTQEHANLDLNIVLACLRPGTSSRQCVDNLKRAVARLENPKAGTVPTLDTLPLTQDVRAWTDNMLADLAAVQAGALSPDRLAHGILEGPPGTGKTLIANSLAVTSGWNFVESSVGSWFTSGDGYLGGVVKNLKRFFDDVLAAAPAIGFLDEIDAIPDRAALDDRAREWWTPVITMFLTQIDQIRKSDRKVLLLGATNYYTRLDSALVRPGRLEQRLSVFPPESEADALSLLDYFAGSMIPRDELSRIARLGIGATPATIEGSWKEAQRLARTQDREPLLHDLIDALTPAETRSESDLRAIAIHEIGHAVVALRLGHKLERVTILPEGRSGGQTLTHLPTIIPNRAVIEEIVMIGLGGRAADTIIGSGPHAGAQNDLARATELLLDARLAQGLGEALVSHAAVSSRIHPTLLNEIDRELRSLLEKAIAIVESDQAIVLSLTEKLLKDRILTGDEIAAELGLKPAEKDTARSTPSSDPKPLAGEDDKQPEGSDAGRGARAPHRGGKHGQL